MMERELKIARLFDQIGTHCTSADFYKGYMAAVHDLRDPEKKIVIEEAMSTLNYESEYKENMQ